MSRSQHIDARAPRRKRLRIWLILPIGGLVFCCFTWVWVTAVLDEHEAHTYDVIVEAEIPFDSESLPDLPTEADYYVLAVGTLSRYGWERPARLTAFGMQFACDEVDKKRDEAWFLFSRKDTIGEGFVDNLLPHVVNASVTVHLSKEIIDLRITDQGIRLGALDTDVDLQYVAVDTERALQIAERRGGRSYRQQVGNRCDLDLILKGNSWSVVYRESEELREVLRIRIDARTGKAH